MILKTKRLYLRELTPDDAKNFHDLNTDPLVTQYTGDPPFENIAAARHFLENYEQYRKYGYGRWAVLLKENEEWIGWCGLKYEAEYADTDIGYRFFRKHWGKGYATESAQACLDHGFQKLKLEKIVARAFKENTASINVMEKIGMQFEKELLLEGKFPGVQYVVEM